MHWGGSSWTQVPAPDGVHNSTNILYGIHAVTAEDVWAVGFDDTTFLNSEPLIEHYDGTAWTVVPSPQFPGNDNILYAIDAAAADDVWTVGFQGDSGTELRTLVEHWDGTSWHVVFTPNLKGTQELMFGVDAVSSTDAWAVGEHHQGAPVATVVEHWDGSHWGLVNSPPTDNGGFDAVLEITPTEVWAVGGVFDPNIANFRPLTMRSKGCSPA